VPVGWTDGGIAHVRIDRAPSAGESIRRIGEDVADGEVVLQSGTHLGSQQVAVIAAVGRARVRARTATAASSSWQLAASTPMPARPCRRSGA